MPKPPAIALWGLTLCLAWLWSAAVPAWSADPAAAPAPSGAPAPAAEAAPSEQPQPPPWRIQQVSFEGFQHITRDEALEVMETKPASSLFFASFPPFDRSSLDRDKQRLDQLYQENGFFEAEVGYNLARDREQRLVSVVFTAKENRPTIIEDVTLELPPGEEGQAWRPRLTPLLRLVKGQRFLLKNYEDSKRLLGDYLRNQAHPLATVLGQVRVHTEDAQATVVLKIEPGPRLAFGATTVSGFNRIKPEFILRELTYARGQPFSQDVLDDSQRALLDTGFFSIVTFTPEYDRAKDGQVPLKLQVREANRYSARFGLGWGNEDGFRVRVLQVNRNLLGLYDTLTFEGKISQIYQGLTGRLKLPYIPSRDSTLLLWGGVEQNDLEAYSNRRLFFNPTVEQRLNPRWSWSLGYNVEKNNIIDLKAAVPDPTYEKQQFYISSLPVGLRYDTRDSILNPTKGLFFNLEVETASDAIGSEVEFLRSVSELRHVLPLPWSKGWYLASRAKGGLAYPLPGTDRIPLIRRFFPGGANSVRGYAFQTLGPLDSAGKPLGGEAMLEGSLELRFPLWGDLGGVLFTDAGNAYDKWEDLRSGISDLRYTAGTGLRYHTPVGPLRLDIGYQLNPPEGGHLSRYEVYLSVGQAF